MAQYRNPQTLAELEEARATNNPGFTRARQERAPNQLAPGAYQVETSPMLEPSTGNIVRQFREVPTQHFSNDPNLGLTSAEISSRDHKALKETYGKGLLDQTMFMDDYASAPTNSQLTYGRKNEWVSGAKIAGAPRNIPLSDTLRGNYERQRALEAGHTRATGDVVSQTAATDGIPNTGSLGEAMRRGDAARSEFMARYGALGGDSRETLRGMPSAPEPTAQTPVMGPTATSRMQQAGMSPYSDQISNEISGPVDFNYSPTSFTSDRSDGLDKYTQRLEADLLVKFGVEDLGERQKEVGREYDGGNPAIAGTGAATTGIGTWSRLADAKQFAQTMKGVEEMTILRQQQKFAKRHRIPLKTVQDPNAKDALYQRHGYTGEPDLDKKTLKKKAKDLIKTSRKQGKFAAKLFGGSARILGKLAGGPVGWAAMGIELGNEIEKQGLSKANDKLLKSDLAPLVVGDLMQAFEEIQNTEGAGTWEDRFNKRSREIVLSWNHIVQDQINNPGLEIDPTAKRGREVFSTRSKLWTEGVKPTDNMKWAMSSTISGATDKRLAQRDTDFQAYRDAKGKRAFANMGFGENQFLDSALAPQQFGGQYMNLGDYTNPDTKEVQPHLGMSFGQFQEMAKQQGYDLPKHDLQNYWASGQQQLMADMRKRRIINFDE